MSADDPDERTVEVLAVPPAVDEELLSLYFENRRRSGGGPLASSERRGDCVVLVFEEASAAARVLSKDQHVLSNAELIVRKPRDQRSPSLLLLLLRGIRPNTCLEMIELYVENMMGLDAADYALSPAPGRDFIFVCLSRPLSKAIEDLSARFSKRTLDGAKVSLEQMEQTDSIYVENLRPGVNADMLELYFERQAGNAVKDVTMLSGGSAKVSFASCDSVSVVLKQPHRMQDSDLVVLPYFDFLQPTPTLTPQDSGAGSQDVNERHLNYPGDACAIPPTSSDELMVDEQDEDLYGAEDEAEDMDVNEPVVETQDVLPGHISIEDPVKLALLKLSSFQEDTERNNPNVKVQIGQSGVHIVGSSRQTLEGVKRSLSDCLGKMAEARFTLEPEKLEFLSREDVKEHLLRALSDSGWPATYVLSDGHIQVTSLSQDSAKQACGFLKSQLRNFSMQVDPHHAGLSCCREWTDFLQTLGLVAVTSWQPDGTLDVLTLEGQEDKKRDALLEFLAAPIERETFLAMELGKLKYLQIYRHQLLAEMAQVSIDPLESDEVCGLKIHGQAVACQMAEEVLRDLVSTISTKTITIKAPGVTRFFLEEESKNLMKKMETRFDVYIIVKQQPWEPLPKQDIFKTAWTMMSDINFPKVSPDSSSGQLNSVDGQNVARGLPDEAMAVVAACNGELGEGACGSEQLHDMEDLDLYTDEEPGSSPGVLRAHAPNVNGAGWSQHLNGGAHGSPSSLDEEAQLSLAIQYSMEVNYLNEDKELQEVLELSKTVVQHKPSSSSDCPDSKTGDALADAIEAASSIQFSVFAVYLSDLTRVDIAYSKRVDQKQAEEKLEHKTFAGMSKYHQKCLEIIKRKHGVEIKVEGTVVTVSGFREYVSEALDDVKQLQDRMLATLPDEELLKVVRWVFHNAASSSAIPYSPEVTVFIENAWRMKLKQVDILLDNQLCRLDLKKLQEYNTVSRKFVKMSRILVDLEDVNELVPVEEFCLLSNLPEATQVDEDSKEFQDLVKSFYETIEDYHNIIRIVKVEKLMNRLLYNQYKLKKASLLQQATLPQVERTLYHGTSEDSVKEICIHGFNRSFCGKNATAYGQGVYFAIKSALSARDTYSPPNQAGYKFIFVSKVLTGDFTKGCHTMKTAPLKETGDIPLRFDSVTDDINRPTMFIIFNDTQAFPEYLITCQKIRR